MTVMEIIFKFYLPGELSVFFRSQKTNVSIWTKFCVIGKQYINFQGSPSDSGWLRGLLP